MEDSPARSWSLPWTSPLPEGARARRLARAGRVAAYALLAGAMLATCIQVQVQTSKYYRAGRKADRAYLDALAAWQAEGTVANRSRLVEAAEVVAFGKRHKGAIARWAVAVRQFWSGGNIYSQMDGAGLADPLTGRALPGATMPEPATPAIGEPPEKLAVRPVWLHPNMPFVVILLTPLAYLPVAARTAVVSIAKVLVLGGSILAVAAVTNHRRGRMGDWVMALAALFVLPLAISDIQHGNTNTFVLGALALHLWLYRRGRDAWSGAALALAICLKMTPALFAVYWLYQRNWRLLGGTLTALAVAIVLVPLAALGPGRFDVLMGSWLHNLILPGLVKGAPYPVHINQSLGGVFSRLLMGGNIYFNPDDTAAAERFGYINLLSLSPAAGRAILTALRLAFVAVMAWAIGWRKLPRDDARRALHYGLLAAAMLILNQRTWDHHAVILLIAYAAVWYALAYARISRVRRICCLAATALAGVICWAMGKSLFTALAGEERGEVLADVVEAYGPMFVHFVIVFVAIAVLLVALRKARPEDPVYASSRQRL